MSVPSIQRNVKSLQKSSQGAEDVYSERYNSPTLVRITAQSDLVVIDQYRERDNTLGSVNDGDSVDQFGS